MINIDLDNITEESVYKTLGDYPFLTPPFEILFFNRKTSLSGTSCRIPFPKSASQKRIWGIFADLGSKVFGKLESF